MRVVGLGTGLDSPVVIHLISRTDQDVIDKSDRCFLLASFFLCPRVRPTQLVTRFLLFVFFFGFTTPKATQNEANQNCGSGRTVFLRYSSSRSAGTGYCHASMCGMIISVSKVYLG